MYTFVPGFVLGFREGLEAALIVSIILRCLTKINFISGKKFVQLGVIGGLAVSAICGFVIFFLVKDSGSFNLSAKIWETFASFIALVLVSFFILWMIKHGSTFVKEIEDKTLESLTPIKLFLLSSVVVAREGVEVVLFSFAGEYNSVALFLGIVVAIILAVQIYFALVNINLSTIFTITLVYLIFQAAFLLGYGVHEGLSSLKDLNILHNDHMLLTKAYDFSGGVFDHKDGLIGLPLFVLFGYYSKPEWLQFVVQHSYLIFFFTYYYNKNLNTKNLKKPAL